MVLVLEVASLWATRCWYCACAGECPVFRWDVRVSSYAAGNGYRGGRSGVRSWLLYLGMLVVVVGTEVRTMCLKVFRTLMLPSAWIACYVCACAR